MTTSSTLALLAKKQAVLRFPALDAVVIRRDLSYRPDDPAATLDIYYPHDGPGAPFPVVILVTGYPMPAAGKAMWGPFTSWARLMAASGMAAVIYASSEPARDAGDVFAFMRQNAPSLELNGARIGLWSTSGNCPTALSLLTGEAAQGIHCAAFCYGYMLEPAGRRPLAEAAKLYGFANPVTGKTTADIRSSLPLFLVRAGLDGFEGVNASMDAFIAGALTSNLRLSVMNHSTGQHAFDLDEDSDTSRALIRQVLDFLACHLKCRTVE